VTAQHKLIEQRNHRRIARFPAGELTQLDQRLLGGQKVGHALLVATAAGWRHPSGPASMRTTRFDTMRPRHGQDGLTLYQLLVAIVVIVILGALWGAHNKSQQIKQQQQSAPPQLRHG